MVDYPTDGPTIQAYYEANRNWGRWGDDDEVGALNLVTDEKRLKAVALVQNGRTVSMNRPYPKVPGPRNQNPAQHFMQMFFGPRAGVVVDHYGFIYHGQSMTHIDALCHVWEGDKLWNGRDPRETLQSTGATFADVTAWRHGIVTRGVLLDVVKHRGEPYVTQDRPVHGEELEAIAAAQGVEVRAGDALIVHSGHTAYVADHPVPEGGQRTRPARLVRAVRARARRVHPRLGPDGRASERRGPALANARRPVQLRRGAARQRAARTARRSLRRGGSLRVHVHGPPLRVEGGTGSPVNPIAMF